MTKQTLEERLKEEFVNGATKWELTDYQIKRLWSWFERNIQQELKANDDAWRERIKGLIEKNKAYDFGIYDYEGIALDLINLLKEKK